MKTALVSLLACTTLAALATWYLCSVAKAATAESTSYSPCSAGKIMADGSRVRSGSAAMNTLPLGTQIYVPRRGPDGRKRYTVRDRIGAYSQLDFWVLDCGLALQWGRRTVTYFVGWPKLRGKVKPKRIVAIPKRWIS